MSGLSLQERMIIMSIQLNIVVDVFSQEAQAQQALDALREAGFAYDQVGVAMREHQGSDLYNDLLNLGISDEHARYYIQEVKVGHTVVSVRADGREQEAHDIMRRCGAYDLLRSTRAYDSYDDSSASETPISNEQAMPLVQPAAIIQTSLTNQEATNAQEDVDQPGSLQPDEAYMPITTNQVQLDEGTVQSDLIIEQELDSAPLVQNDVENEQALQKEEERIARLVSEESVNAEILLPQTQREEADNRKKVRNGLLLGGLLLGLGSGMLLSFLRRENIRQFVISTLQTLKQQINNMNRSVRDTSK